MRPVLSTKFSLLKSRRGGLNSRPTVYETVALPLSYSGMYFYRCLYCTKLEPISKTK